MKIGRGFEEKIFGNLIHPGTAFQILITFLLHCVNNIPMQYKSGCVLSYTCTHDHVGICWHDKKIKCIIRWSRKFFIGRSKGYLCFPSGPEAHSKLFYYVIIEKKWNSIRLLSRSAQEYFFFRHVGPLTHFFFFR